MDADLLVRGDAAAEARTYFMELWESEHVWPSRLRDPGRVPEDRVDVAAAALDRHRPWLEERVAAASAERALRAVTAPALLAPAPAEVGPVCFLHDPVGRKGEAPGVGHAVLDLLDDAREEIVIESLYLGPSRAFRRGLPRALDRDLRVRTLTNSLDTGTTSGPSRATQKGEEWAGPPRGGALGVHRREDSPLEGCGDRGRDRDCGLPPFIRRQL